jgi:hypothetical protein
VSDNLLEMGSPEPQECDSETIGQWRGARGLPPVSPKGVQCKLGILGPPPVEARSPIDTIPVRVRVIHRRKQEAV